MTSDNSERYNQIAAAAAAINNIGNAESSPLPSSVITRKKILVVDDEPDITSVLRKGLCQYGFEVDIFNDPIKALLHFKIGHYDLLLIDIQMPKMNGFKLCEEIQRIDDKVKVYFMTAIEIYLDEFKRVFPKSTINCFVNKPFSINALAKVLKTKLEVIPT
jgi:DNA-binding response OmpR family regulator